MTKSRQIITKAVIMLLSVVALVYGILTSPTMAAPDQPWQIDKAQSALKFTAKQLGVAMTGSFSRFEAIVVFDPTAPDKATLEVMIDTASASTDQSEADSVLPGPDFFAVKTYPQAVYKAQGFKPLGENRYQVDGSLTLKGTTKEIPLIAVIIIGKNGTDFTADATAKLTLSRTAFNIGAGQWAATDTIADDVELKISLKANRPQ